VPTIEIVDGIRILMYLNDHAPPHFHVRFGDMKGKFVIATGELLSGNLDRRTLKKVQAWTELNRDLLMTKWAECQTRR
jgi:hypothetical protein